MELEKLKFPIGAWKPKKSYSEKELAKFISVLEKYPAKIKRLTKNLSDNETLKTYREGSWNIRQLVHHLADTHVLHYLRFMHALTEENPTGVVGKVNDWAMLKAAIDAPLESSFLLLEGTHRRYAYLAKTLTETDLKRTYFHPQRQLTVTLAQGLSMSAWHIKHHFEHIKIALKQ